VMHDLIAAGDGKASGKGRGTRYAEVEGLGRPSRR
jgi:hypothetical protein